MRIRLVVHGDLDGSPSEFWKDIEDAVEVPRVGEVVELGVRTGAAPHLDQRTVVNLSWGPSLDLATVVLDDLHPGWLQANRRSFGEAGWIAAMAGLS